MKAIKFPLALIFIFSLFISCKDRFFDNPFDPNQEERGYEIEATIPIGGLVAMDLTFSGDSLWIITDSSNILSLNYNSGNIIRQLFVEANTGLNGICYNGSDLWLNIENTTQIFRVSIINGETLKNLNLAEGRYSVMDYYEGHIYIADQLSHSIFQIVPETGEIIQSITIPSFSVDGICFDGNHLWILDSPALKIYRMTIEGTTVAVYQTPDKNPTGLCFSQGIVWCADKSGKIFKLRFPPVNQAAPAIIP